MNKGIGRRLVVGKMTISIWLIFVLLLIVSCAPRQLKKDKVITWNVSLWGGRRAWTKPLHEWAADMERKTNGRWKIKLHYGAVLAAPKKQLNGIRAGKFEAAGICCAYTPGKLPLHTVAELPFITPHENIDIFQMVVELWKHPALKKELLKWNAVPLLAGGLCQYQLMGNKPIRKVADLKGARVRMGGEIGKVLRGFGAVPTLIPAPKVYEALSRGTVDLVGFPWASIYGAYKIHQVSKYITIPISLGTMNCPFIANKDAWDALPEEFKQYHKQWYYKSPKVWAAEWKKADDKWIPIFKQTLEFIDFLTPERNKLVAKAEEFYEKWVRTMERQGLPGRDILEYYLKKRKEITGY